MTPVWGVAALDLRGWVNSGPAPTAMLQCEQEAPHD